VKLYSAALDYLLEFRDDRRKIPPLLHADKARLVLSPVALWMQQELETDEAERSAMHAEMEKVLSTFDHPPSAEAFCRNLIDRAGLLVELGETRKEYLFRHKTFREYLAGGQLTEAIKRNSGLIAPLVEHFGEDWWNEPLTFFMAQADATMFDRFMEELFKSKVSAEFSSKQQTLLQTIITEAPQKTTEALCRKLLMPDTTANRQRYILDCLKVVGKKAAAADVRNFINKGFSTHTEIATTEIGRKAVEVFNVLVNRDIDAKCLRVELAKISQNESSNVFITSFEQGAQYILIPGGKYIYSVTEKEVSVPDRWFAKYPVTNRQYRSFVGFLAGKPEEHTKELSVTAYTRALQDLARSGNDAVKGFDEYFNKDHDLVKRFTSGYDDDRKFNKDDQPVVGVSWFDARAYCLWLSMLTGEEFRLPTEQEWEWAVGGRREEPRKVLKVREYPWGDKPEPTPKHANYGQNEGATTPVGRYPDGATPEGLYDMAGNVWEWMEDWASMGWKALRGGSWYYGPENLRCLMRNSFSPVSRYYDFGFRVVCPSPKM
jgi:formylglycine-generating enzyme required for sulfatase activity